MSTRKEGQPARTRYRVIERAGNRAAWVELQPLTGRTHQLRVHMAAIGHPIVGDGKYGGQEAFLTGAISRKMHLHARRLRIDHPDGAPLDVTAPLPEHFANSLAPLGFDEDDGDDLPDDAVEPRQGRSRSACQGPRQADPQGTPRRTPQARRRTRALTGAGGKSGGKPAGKSAAKPGARSTAAPCGEPSRPFEAPVKPRPRNPQKGPPQASSRRARPNKSSGTQGPPLMHPNPRSGPRTAR